jgi:hypothetical protein
MAFAPSPQPRPILPLSLRFLAPGFYGLAALAPLWAATTPLVVRVNDWAAMPLSGDTSTASGLRGYLARVNFMRPEPGGTGRMWVCDLNGNLYLFSTAGSFANRSTQLLDQARTRSAYLDFNGQSGTTNAAEKTWLPDSSGTDTSDVAPNGLFPLFTKQTGLANGLVTFEFDPGYATNGKFYTVHTEVVSADGNAGRIPVTTKYPGFDTSGYTSTPRIHPPGTPGSSWRHAVLIEWTDTNRSNLSFEGSARELMRIGYNANLHPLGDITFDPTARPGDPEYGVMYLASGDGKSGETYSQRMYPQYLSSLVGKILRIIPDTSLHTATSTVSSNGRYRVPNDNPFTGIPGARPEVWTLGHRNPHRFAWHVNEDGKSPVLMVNEIGLDGWEEVNFLKRGKNYGYSEREGPQKLTIPSSGSSSLSALPSNDTLLIRISNFSNAPGEFIPEYPVLAYSHSSMLGDAISNGFFYRGSAIPSLHGKYVFGDITTGRVWACEWEDMLEADDGNPASVAEFQPVTFLWDDPNDSPDGGLESYDRLFNIVLGGYDFRGGEGDGLPGGSSNMASGTGRADIRLALDAAGELYVTSKSDGMIRSLGTVFTTQPLDRLIALGADTTFTIAVSTDAPPTYQWQRLPEGSGSWTNVTDNSVFSGATTATLSLDSPGYEYNGSRFRCVATCAGAQAISTSARLDLRAIPDSWLSTYFNATERANAAISGDLADPDRDGLVNLLEYAFAFNPEADSSAVMPKIERAGGNVKLVFPVPRATLNYTVQKSTNLSTWSTSGITLSTSAGKITATVPLSSGPETFLRIVVTPQ